MKPLKKLLKFRASKNLFVICFLLNPIAIFANPQIPTDEVIRNLYVEEQKLVNAAWLKIPLEDPRILQPEKVLASQSEYDYKKDPNWSKRCIKAEAKFKELIETFKAKEGRDNRNAAVLCDHLSSLYHYSGNGDSRLLKAEAERVLFPACPKCHKQDEVAMLSPAPNQTIDEQLKSGWWNCRHCDKIFRLNGKRAWITENRRRKNH